MLHDCMIKGAALKYLLGRVAVQNFLSNQKGDYK